MSSQHENGTPSSIRRVALASAIGTTVEWYDYFVYASASALIFGRIFFPEYDVAAGTFAAFVTFALGYVVRPLGGALFGHLGDRMGRKRMLVFSLVLMGASTFAIGLLPTYAALGAAAPILLLTLRLLQGFAVSGEWGGATLMSVEHAPAHRRGFYGSWPQIGLPAGIILANGVLIVMTSTLSDDQFQSWGWRVPFLLSAVLVGIGLYIRLAVEESPAFTRAKSADVASQAPLVEMFRRHGAPLVLGSLALVGGIAVGYLILVFALSYGTQSLGLGRGTMLTCVLVAAAVGAVAIPTLSAVSDRIGRRRVFLGGALGQVVWAFPFFWLMDTGSVPLIVVSMCVMQIVTYAMVSVIGAMLSEIFPTHVRYTGASLCYQFGSILGGAVAPLVATAILASTGSTTWISAYIVVMAVISAGAVVALGETSRRRLDEGTPLHQGADDDRNDSAVRPDAAMAHLDRSRGIRPLR